MIMKKYEWEPTKSQPGRYSWLLNDIAELECVPSTKVIQFDSLEKARKAKFKLPDMVFSINGNDVKCLGSTIRKGGFKVLLFDGFEIPFDGYSGGVSIEVRKTLAEYATKPKNAGSYKNCEGGGWYSMAILYELNGIFYTDAY